MDFLQDFEVRHEDIVGSQQHVELVNILVLDTREIELVLTDLLTTLFTTMRGVITSLQGSKVRTKQHSNSWRSQSRVSNDPAWTKEPRSGTDREYAHL